MAGHEGGVLSPVARTASGGELARLSLAIQTVTRRVAPVPTLVFDEVDAGIGGGVAEIVGQMLRALGHGRQTLCITHLPQVAAAADHHWRVAKKTEQGRTRSTVELLDTPGRIGEVARMLGGVRITEATLAHAAEMLATPHRPSAHGALGGPAAGDALEQRGSPPGVQPSAEGGSIGLRSPPLLRLGQFGRLQ